MYHERQQLQRCMLHTLNNLLQQQSWTVQSLNELTDNIHATRTRWLGNYDANVLAAALQQHGLDVKWHDARDTHLTSLDLTRHHSTTTSSTTSSSSPDGSNSNWKQAAGGASAVMEQVQQQQPALMAQLHRQQGKYDSSDCRQQEQIMQHQHRHHHQQQQQEELVGLVLNVAGRGLLSSLLGGRHWLAIRWLEGQWWNLDSQLSHPVSFKASLEGAGSIAHSAAAAAAAAGRLAGHHAASAAAEAEGDRGLMITTSSSPAAPAAAVLTAENIETAAAEDGGAAALKVYLQQQLRSGAHLLLVTRAHPQHPERPA